MIMLLADWFCPTGYPKSHQKQVTQTQLSKRHVQFGSMMLISKLFPSIQLASSESVP